MKMLIWEYNNKLYLKINDVKVKGVADMLRKDELHIGNAFKRNHTYIVDLTFGKYGFQKRNGEQITGYSISEINKNV